MSEINKNPAAFDAGQEASKYGYEISDPPEVIAKAKAAFDAGQEASK